MQAIISVFMQWFVSQEFNLLSGCQNTHSRISLSTEIPNLNLTAFKHHSQKKRKRLLLNSKLIQNIYTLIDFVIHILTNKLKLNRTFNSQIGKLPTPRPRKLKGERFQEMLQEMKDRKTITKIHLSMNTNSVYWEVERWLRYFIC